MSLTSELDDRSGAIRMHLDRRVSILDASKRGSPLAPQMQHLLGLDELPKAPAFPPLVPLPMRGIVGTAIDYRIRYYFEAVPARSLIAYQAELRIATVGEAFFTALDGDARVLSPARRRLNDDDEERWCRYCVVLAHLDALYRAGPSFNSPLLNLPVDPPLDEVLKLPDLDVVKDVMQLSRAFFEDARLPDDAGWMWDLPHVLNPSFAGSKDIGNADADLILQDALWELKVVAKPRPQDVRDAILQLLGYTLLDYDDSYHIRTVVLCLLRHRPGTRSWPLWMFLLPPAEVMLRLRDDRLPDEEEVAARLSSLREEFRRLLSRGTCDCPCCADGLGQAGKDGE